MHWKNRKRFYESQNPDAARAMTKTFYVKKIEKIKVRRSIDSIHIGYKRKLELQKKIWNERDAEIEAETTYNEEFFDPFEDENMDEVSSFLFFFDRWRKSNFNIRNFCRCKQS